MCVFFAAESDDTHHGKGDGAAGSSGDKRTVCTSPECSPAVCVPSTDVCVWNRSECLCIRAAGPLCPCPAHGGTGEMAAG